MYRSLCRSITMHASTEKSGGSKSYYSICMLQRNMVLRQRLKHCKTVGAPSQAEVWLYGLNPPPPPPPPPLHFSYRATHLGHRPLVRSTFTFFRTPPFPDLATGLGFCRLYMHILYLLQEISGRSSCMNVARFTNTCQQDSA